MISILVVHSASTDFADLRCHHLNSEWLVKSNASQKRSFELLNNDKMMAAEEEDVQRKHGAEHSKKTNIPRGPTLHGKNLNTLRSIIPSGAAPSCCPMYLMA